MSTYIIGDVQGCFTELQTLLQHIHFDPQKDQLGFVGDLVNRGPHSLEVLRFIKQLPSPMVVLGNHDLFCLMLGYRLIPEDAYPHTLNDILHAPDKMALLDWLRQQPLLWYDGKRNLLLVHAGLPPQWNIAQCMHYAKEVETVLHGTHYAPYLTHL